MPKITRRIKRSRKNKTSKIGGDGSSDKRKGIIDIANEKIADATSSVIGKMGDAGLYALGLEKINKPDDKDIDVDIKKVTDTASGIASDISNTVDKTSANVINDVNEVLDSDVVNKHVENAAKDTADITSKLSKNFNDAMNDPDVRENVDKAIENVADISTVAIKSAEKPMQEAVKVGIESGNKALGAASGGIIRVGTDMMAAIPYVGAIIEVGKILNDGSKAASAVVEAGSEAIETASDAFVETTENMKQGLKELEEKKKLAEQISNRTTKSINDFENPIPATKQTAGGRKSKRRLFKRKSKTKRVRFAI